MVKARRIIFYIAILLIGGLAAFSFTPYLRSLLFSTGVLQEKIMIAGTGSMYPTFPKGQGTTDLVQAQEIVAWPKMRQFPGGISILGKDLFSYHLQHKDIVDFENAKTQEISRQKYGEDAGFVKRIIALPGDTIDLRDGYVILNGQNLTEPYTAKPRSTYGGDFLSDCRSITIPQGKVFVMGDNRKASLDSRFELGLVDISDIKYVLPWDKQEEYKKTFRDTSGDNSLANTATLDGAEFVRLLNEKRSEKNLKPYKSDPLLSLSGKRRGNVMITTDDFSSEATKSGVTMSKTLAEVGYHNIVFAEVFTRGFYEAGELLDNFLEFPQTKDILFSDKYQDIGLAPVLGSINNCPTQVVVVQMGGYVPPDYKPEDVAGWQKLADNLNMAITSWGQLENASNIDQSKLEKLLGVLRQRKVIADKVYSRMKANQWLTDAEENLVQQDKSLAQEANDIISELTQNR